MQSLLLASVATVFCYACKDDDNPAVSAATAPFPPSAHHPQAGQTLMGKDAFGGWTTDAPGVRRKITAADLPGPYETRSSNNGAHIVPRPQGAWPVAPAGFKVEEYATGLHNPREIITAPNGDLFVAESGAGSIRILRGRTPDGKPEKDSTFVTGLNMPFGMAFYPPGPHPAWLYVGNTDSVVRFAYKDGDLQASGGPQTIVPDIPSGGHLTGGGHWTRDVRFSADGKQMFVSVGSFTNDYENPNAAEKRRADILEFDPEGKNEKIYASGIRNAVGLAVQPKTGQLWCSVNERDALGDDVPPDYITRVNEGQFYGWPWFYIGDHQDPRHPNEHAELKDKISVPEVLIQAHSASLCMTFYTGKSFPASFDLDGFAAEHGSWNREKRTGYKVIRVPLKNGAPTGEYEDFLTGFVTQDGDVWGRPVGVTVAPDGALMVSDDAENCIWRVQYEK
jgi:glucose/arabinose dehydrogenase